MDTANNQYRQQAVEWLNSKERDTDKAIEILQQAGYKPNLISFFVTKKNRCDIPKKVEKEIRFYIRFCTDATNSIHNDIPTESKTISDESINLAQELKNEYPDIVKTILLEYRKLYTTRSKLHNELKQTGESNDVVSTEKRKSICEQMDHISRRLDKLWPAFEKYKTDGTIPDEKILKYSEKKAEPTKNETVLVLPNDLEALKKMKENFRIKIAKTRNQLDYQSDSKTDKEPNPMPEGPKRIMKEKYLKKCESILAAVELKIAELK